MGNGDQESDTRNKLSERTVFVVVVLVVVVLVVVVDVLVLDVLVVDVLVEAVVVVARGRATPAKTDGAAKQKKPRATVNFIGMIWIGELMSGFNSTSRII